MDNTLLIEKIKRLCKFEAIAPTKACIESGAGKDFIANLIKGRTPSVEKVQKLATYLGVTTSELLGEEKPPMSEDNGRIKSALANASTETREAINLLLQLHPDNLDKAKEYIRFELAKQEDSEDKN